MMSGGALARCTLFALGVTPYINASIIVQLLTVAIPSLENLAKEADGQQKLQQINRYAGAVVALIMSIGYYFVIRNMGALEVQFPAQPASSPLWSSSRPSLQVLS